MKKRVFSIILSLILVITAIAPVLTVANAAVWTGSRSVPSISGGVYQIANGENLAWFANAVNTGNNTIKGELTANIQLNYSGSHTNVWTPIGTENYPFNGTFDGKGYTISGLYVDTDIYCSGLFGYIVYDYAGEEDDVSAEYIIGTKEYTIKNIIVTDSYVSGTQNVGGIVGYASNAGILECSYSGSVSGTENSVGGIVGWACTSTVISQCHSSGSVSGHQRVGGTAGYCNGNAVITKCYGDMNVSGYMNVGGVVGTLSAGSMRGAFFFGSVSADDRAGGITGYSAFGNMLGAYTISAITNTADGTDFGGAVGVIYGGSYTSIFYSYETAGFDGPAGIGRTVTEMQTRDFVKELNRATPYFCFDYTGINNGYPVLTWMLKMDVWAGDLVMPQQTSYGTYIISKPSELAWFAGLVNGTLSGIEQNSAANANVTANLLFNIDVNDDTMGRTEWTPIGTAESPYTGTFNGNGYNIAGVYVAPTAGDSGKNVGLFGYVGTGSVSNVIVIDGLICGKENVGGIAGLLSGGSLTNCVCDSEVQGDKAVGGVAGYLASATSKVTTCCMMGKITGTNISGEASFSQNVGGVVGYSNKGVINKSFASSQIDASVSRFVGGIVGNNAGGSVTSCYSISTVVGNINAGGLVGYNNNGTVTKCYTAGKVSGISQVGIAFGTTLGANVSYCFYDDSFISLANTYSGATAKTPVQMTGAYSLSNMYLGSDFKATEDDTYFYYYPQIYSMAYSSTAAIKNASLKSVKKVQNKYIARVEIDGRTDTYYETLEDAFDYAGSTASLITPTVFLLRDKEIDTTITIPSEVSFFGENGAILSRAATLTESMLNITGNVSLGSSLYGYDDSTALYIDGASVAAAKSAIVVASNATLHIQEGVCIRNCATSTTTVRGAAVSSTGGTISMEGGKLSTNISKSVAGGIYIQDGILTVSGGVFENNEGTQGGAIYNNNSEVIISGGTFTGNIAKGQFFGGGAVSGYGVYSTTTVTGNAVFTANAGEEGGALCVRNYGTIKIDGGSFKNNRAYSMGGALYIEDGSEAFITGGLITENYSDKSLGNAVYNNGDFTIGGAGKIYPDNDVYLPSGKYITVNDRLSCSGYAAKITPQNYTEGTKVINGSEMISNYSKFSLTDTSWRILATGKITGKSTASVAILSKEHAYSIEYVNLEDAFAAVNDGETANITLIADTTVNSVIPVHGDITFSCDDTTFTAMRNETFYGVMFDVQSGSVLRLGDKVASTSQQAQSDYRNGTQTAGQIIIDGGYEANGVTGAAAVNIQSGGELYIYDDAIIRNCRNTTTGVITVSGKMHMFGGTICSNNAKYGSIYVKSTGILNTYGGVIADNTSTNIGDAVYSLGKVYRNIYSYDFYYIETLYGIDEESGETVVIGMADPVYKATLKTDILIDNDTVYLNSNTVYTAEAQENIYIRNLEQLPESTEFVLNSMPISLRLYTVGNTVVSGTNVADYCAGFAVDKDGYGILENGKLALTRLALTSTAKLIINRTNNTVSGISLSSNRVNTILSNFANTKTDMRIVSADGTVMTSLQNVTTGYKIQLLNLSKEVIDEIEIVVFGDLNGDMKIDGQDAVIIKTAAAGMLNSSNASAGQLAAADVNSDGSITNIDAESVEACGLFLQTL